MTDIHAAEALRSPSTWDGPARMWAQYRKTLVVTQALICLVTLAVYFGMHKLWALALLYFLTMQVGAVLGAAWSLRLKRKIERTTS